MSRFRQILLISLLLFSGNCSCYLQLPQQLDARLDYRQLVLHRLSGAGLFASFNAVLGLLHLYDLKQYPGGIKIDFGKTGFYFEKKWGKNYWQYYFEPLDLGGSFFSDKSYIPDSESPLEKLNASDYSKIGWHLSRKRANYLMKKYIKVASRLQEIVARFESTHFTKPVIGIHYRGTDKCRESPRIPYENMANAIDEALQDSAFVDCQLFVATDEVKFLEFMQSLYGNRVICTASLRSSDGLPIHSNGQSPHLKGQQAVVDCLLLADCDLLIRNDSCLSLTASRFSLDLPEIVVTP